MGGKEKTLPGSTLTGGGLLKALLAVVERIPASQSRAVQMFILLLTGWWGFAISFDNVWKVMVASGRIAVW